MDKEQGMILAKLRLDRAKELVTDSQELLKKGSYKSANNRAFYAIEKSIKALLAMELVEVITHNGALKQFNLIFIWQVRKKPDSRWKMPDIWWKRQKSTLQS